MKKAITITLSTGLIVLVAAGAYLGLHQKAHNTVKVNTHSVPNKQNQALTEASPQKTSLRPDLLSAPAENEVTPELVIAGEDSLNNRQVSDQTSQLDMTNLSLGDFSSLAGTWADANGYTFIFSSQGLVTNDGNLSMGALVYDANGEAVSLVSLTDDPNNGGFNLYYYPAGLEIPAWHFAITNSDPSDFGRDRLIASQINRFDYESSTQFINNVFYKISDAPLAAEQIRAIKIDTEVRQEIEEKSTTELFNRTSSASN